LSFDPGGRKELSFFHIVRINHKYGVSVIKHTKQIIIKMSSTNAIININANCTTFDEDEVTSAYTPVKKSPWESFKGFWMTHHNLRRHPFAAPGHPKSTAGEKDSAWTSFKGFWVQHNNLRRYPFYPPGTPVKTVV